MKKLSKRMLSMLLSVAMVVTMLPVFAMTSPVIANATEMSQGYYEYINSKSEYTSRINSGVYTAESGVSWDDTEGAVKLNGGKLRINIQNDNPWKNVSQSTGFSLSFDFKHITGNGQGENSRIIDINDGTTTNTFAYNGGYYKPNFWDEYFQSIILAKVDNKETRFYANDAGNSNYCDYKTSEFCGYYDEWHNVTLSMGTDCRLSLYFDGVLRCTYKSNYSDVFTANNHAASTTEIVNGVSNMKYIDIGRAIYNDPYWYGYVRNVRMYGHEIGSNTGTSQSVSPSDTSWNLVSSSKFAYNTDEANQNNCPYSSWTSGNVTSDVQTTDGSNNIISWFSNSVGNKWSDNGVIINDGYLYVNGYKSNLVSGKTPITGAKKFKIECDFFFTNTFDLGTSRASGSFGFLKIGQNGTHSSSISTSDTDNSKTMKSDCFFAQSSSGQTYDCLHGDAPTNALDRSVAPISTNKLSNKTRYRYVLEYTGTMLHPYILNENGSLQWDYGYSTGDFNTDTITSIVFGAGDNNYYMHNVQYRNVRIYTDETAKENYLIAYFCGNSDWGEQLRYAVSEDGVNFKALNKGYTVWNSKNDWNITNYTVGDNSTGIALSKHVRDPYVFKGQNGKYYIIATDLNTRNNTVFSNDTKLLVWELDDLKDIDSTTPWTIDTQGWHSYFDAGGASDSTNVKRAWAPQAIWDPSVGKYMLYFGAGFGSSTSDPSYIYYVYTSDFKTFDSTPQKLLTPYSGANNNNYYGHHNAIDSDITYDTTTDTYYMWFKDESTKELHYATSTSCSGPYTNQGILTYHNNNDAIISMEGPQVYTLLDGTYALISDEYDTKADPANSMQGVYRMFTSSTLNGFNSNSMNNSLTLPFLYARHGSVTKISSSEYSALIYKYGIPSDTDEEFYFTGNTSGGSGWIGTTKDPGGHEFQVGYGTSYSAKQGVLTLNDKNLFIVDSHVLADLRSGSFTVTFKNTITDANKLAATTAIATVANNGTTRIALCGDGSFVVNGKTCIEKANVSVNEEHSYKIVYDGSIVCLFQDNTFVTAGLADVALDSSTVAYLGIGGDDQYSSNKIIGTYADLVISGSAENVTDYLSVANSNYYKGYSGAVNNDCIEAAEAAISSFETQMATLVANRSSGMVYKNLLSRYNQYVKVNRLLDAYKYGNGNKSSLGTTLASESIILGTMADSMPALWNSYSGTTVTTAEDGSIPATLSNGDKISNVIYYYGLGGANYSSDVKIGKCCGRTFYGPIVFLQYNNGEMACPINFATHRNGSGKRKLTTASVNTAGFEFRDWWCGNNSGSSSGVAEYASTYQSGNSWVEYRHDYNDYNTADLNTNYFFFTNTLYCTLNIGNNYTAYYTPQFRFQDNSNKRETGTITDSKPVYIVNYDYFKSQAESKDGMNFTVTNGKVSSYKEGGLAARFEAYDNVTGYNPRTARLNNGTSTDVATGVSNINSDMTSFVNALTTTTVTTDSGYSSLRTAFAYKNSALGPYNDMTPKELIENAAVVSTEVENYSDFVTAYDNAAKHMQGLVTNNYHYGSDNLTDLAENLKDAVDALVYIDRSEFDEKVDEFEGIYATLGNVSTQEFTTSSINNLNENLLPDYQAACNKATSNTAVSAQTTKLTTAIAALDPLANTSALDKAYQKADTLLVSLDNKAPQYSAASLNALIAAVQAAGEPNPKSGKSVSDIINATAEDKADFGQKVQADADDFAEAINEAYDNLTPVDSGSSASEAVKSAYEVYEAAANMVNHIDPDMYDNTDSIATQITAAQEALANELDVSYKTATIKTVDVNVDAQTIDSITGTIMNALNTSIKEFSVSSNADSTGFRNGKASGSSSPYTATYGTTVVCNSDDENTVWFLTYTSATGKGLTNQFQGIGKKFKVKVYGDTVINAEKSSTTAGKDKLVKIVRNYYNGETKDEKAPVQFADYVSAGNFTLPEARAIPFYEFDGYYVGSTRYSAGDKVNISEDETEIIAKYNLDAEGSSCAINAVDYNRTERGYSAAYNERISLKGNNSSTYAWIEKIAGTENDYRPFYIGEDVSFLATEPTDLKAVDETAFSKTYGLTVPWVNLRQSGTVKEGTKTLFNGQIVYNSAIYNIDDTTAEGYGIKEYGILVGAATGETGYIPDESQLVVENTGRQDGYAVLRAKSTKLVGANQFTISVNNLPEAGFIYRAYVVYKDSEGTHTKYSPAMNN